MMIQRSAVVIGLFFGSIAFVICVFLIPPHIALLFGAFTGAAYTLVTSIIVNRGEKKHVADYEIIGREILYKERANYYSGKLVGSGILYLTEGSLIFISHEKKQTLREDMPITSIKDASHGALLRHITGLKITMDDGSEKGFAVANVHKYTDKIYELLSFTTRIMDHLGCECEVITNPEDITVIMDKYEDLLARGKEEGFIPLIIVPGSMLCQVIENEAMPCDNNRHIDHIIKEINAIEFLNSRIQEAMPMGEDNDFDIMGTFVSCEPDDVFYSLMDEMERPYETLIIAKIPTTKPWELAAWIPMGGWNNCPTPAEQVAVFKYWHEKYGAIPAVVHGDIWEMYIENPPSTKDSAAALALEQFGFCSTGVLPHMEKINVWASALVNSKVWYFGWD